MIDWSDIAIHCAIAIAAVVIAAIGALHWPMAGAVAVVFIGREAWQFRQKYNRWDWPWYWSLQKFLEGVAPAVVALAVAGAWQIVKTS